MWTVNIKSLTRNLSNDNCGYEIVTKFLQLGNFQDLEIKAAGVFIRRPVGIGTKAAKWQTKMSYKMALERLKMKMDAEQNEGQEQRLKRTIEMENDWTDSEADAADALLRLRFSNIHSDTSSFSKLVSVESENKTLHRESNIIIFRVLKARSVFCELEERTETILWFHSPGQMFYKNHKPSYAWIKKRCLRDRTGSFHPI